MTKAKMLKGTKVLIGASVCTFLVGAASLANTVMAFQAIVTQYSTQGYPVNEILKQLIPSQLLPGIFQSVGMYMGLSIVLFGLASINEKLRPAAVEVEAVETVAEAVVAEEVTEEVTETQEVSVEKAE